MRDLPLSMVVLKVRLFREIGVEVAKSLLEQGLMGVCVS